MRWLPPLLPLIVNLTVSICVAQSSAQTQPSNASSTADTTLDSNVIGQVLLNPEGSVAANVPVSIVDPVIPKIIQSTRTDSEGKYEFSHIPRLGNLYVVQLGQQLAAPGVWSEELCVNLTDRKTPRITRSLPPLYTNLTSVSGQVVDVDTG
jgi:hypothetical protein